MTRSVVITHMPTTTFTNTRLEWLFFSEAFTEGNKTMRGRFVLCWFTTLLCSLAFLPFLSCFIQKSFCSGAYVCYGVKRERVFLRFFLYNKHHTNLIFIFGTIYFSHRTWTQAKLILSLFPLASFYHFRFSFNGNLQNYRVKEGTWHIYNIPIAFLSTIFLVWVFTWA